MKKIKIILPLLFALMLYTISSAYTQTMSDWTVNPSQFEYSMTITAAFKIDGVAQPDTADVISAFSGGECLGLASPLVMNDGQMIAFLMVHSNTFQGDTLQIYYKQKSTGNIITIVNEIVFSARTSQGDPDEPVLLSNRVLNDGAEITEFSLPFEILDAKIDATNNTITAYLPQNMQSRHLQATFQVSAGAGTFVNNELQTSGNSVNDYSDDVSFTVIAENMISKREWTVQVVSVDTVQGTDFIFFSVPNQLKPADIDNKNRTIQLTLPVSDENSASPVFDLSPGATAYVNSVRQISGNSHIDLSDTVEYLVLSKDNIMESIWKVTVKKLSTSTHFLSFKVDGQTGPAEIDSANYSIVVHRPKQADISSLVPEFTLTAGTKAYINSIKQNSGVSAVNFKTPVTYTLVSEDSIQSVSWKVQVIEDEYNTACIIRNFSLPGQVREAQIDSLQGYINVLVEAESVDALNDVAPVFSLSGGASCYHQNTLQLSGNSKQDFRNEVTYTVKAENDTSYMDWTVYTDIIPPGTSTNTGFIDFDVHGQLNPPVINPHINQIDVVVDKSVDLSQLEVDFEINDFATFFISNEKVLESKLSLCYTEPVIFTVLAADGKTEEEWVLVVTQKELSDNTEVISFSVAPQTDFPVINSATHRIDITVGTGTDVTNLIPVFELSEGAVMMFDSVQIISGVSGVDLSQPQLVQVIAEDGKTKTNWVVSATVLSSINKNPVIEGITILSNTGKSLTLRLNTYMNPQNQYCSVYDMQGKEVMEKRIAGNIIQLDLSHLQNGYYIVKIQEISMKITKY